MKRCDGKSKYADLILIAALLLLAGGMLLLRNLTRREGGSVVVRVNGQETARYALAESGEYALNGGSNILVIEDGRAWLRDADCPDKLCVKQGKVRYTGEKITCLPNQVTITVEGGEDSGYDVKVGTG